MKKNNAPELDLSFAYGESIVERLGNQVTQPENDEEEVSTGDTTIRAVTSLFFGKRKISGLEGIDIPEPEHADD